MISRTAFTSLRLVSAVTIGVAAFYARFLVDLINPTAYSESPIILAAVRPISIAFCCIGLFALAQLVACLVGRASATRLSLDLVLSLLVIGVSLSTMRGAYYIFASYDIIRSSPTPVLYDGIDPEFLDMFKWSHWLLWAVCVAEIVRGMYGVASKPSANAIRPTTMRYTVWDVLSVAIASGSAVCLIIYEFSVADLFDRLLAALPNNSSATASDYATWLVAFRMPFFGIASGLFGTGVALVIKAFGTAICGSTDTIK